MPTKRVILTSDRVAVSEEAMAELTGLDVEFAIRPASTEAELIEAAAAADAVITVTEPFTAAVISALSHCQVIARLGIGVDSVDVDAATASAVWVTNVPDANYLEVSTHALSMALALSRRLPLLDRSVKSGEWNLLAGGMMRRPSDQLFGVIGFGRIGRRVAVMAQAIGYTVWAYDPNIPTSAVEAAGFRSATLDEIVAGSDILSLQVPLLPATAGMFGADRIGDMKPGSILINVSRGGLVDESAVADAVRAGHLSGAGLDVFSTEPLEPSSPLRGLDRVLLSPHAAHLSAESLAETTLKAFGQVAQVLRGERPSFAVNSVE